ncbi:MAG: hypothetical protein MHM6MM_009490, partial [Cercozoa sp. M6MM]
AFTECGTSGWVAPEVFDPPDSGYDSKIDVFSFAVCVWEMLTRCAHNPLAGREEEDIDFDDLIVVKPRIGQGRSAVVSHALVKGGGGK